MQYLSYSNEPGEKYDLAKKVNIKLTNHRWLEDWYCTAAFPYILNCGSCVKYYNTIVALYFILQLKVMGNSSSR
jgi:hypothetical protein